MQRNIESPEIRIQYSRLLDPFFRSLFELELEKDIQPEGVTYNNAETILNNIKEYKISWHERAPVLTYMQETLQLDFYQTTIDVFVVGRIKNAISSPMIISSTKTPDEFVDILTHELLHRLISDSKQKIPAKDILLKLFPTETMLCRNHVVVHAVLKKIYLEFLKVPQRLAIVKEHDKKSPDYLRAWEIVDEQGEDDIIAKFRQLYES